MKPLLKTVFHVHTSYSDDSNTSPEQMVSDALAAGVDCLTITDHDEIEGAYRTAELAPAELKVIIGEEISTAQGHLVGLFLHERIEPGLSVRRTAERIRGQGGLVVVPHPFNTLFGCSLRRHVHDILALIDVVEIANAQNFLPFPNRRAQAFAREHGFPGIVGSDMHHRGYLETCWQWVPPFSSPTAFVAALREAHYVVGRHGLPYFVRSGMLFALARLGLRLPGGYGADATTTRPKHLLATPAPLHHSRTSRGPAGGSAPSATLLPPDGPTRRPQQIPSTS